MTLWRLPIFLSIIQIVIHQHDCHLSRATQNDCAQFMSYYNNARNLVSLRRLRERNLQSSGFVLGKNDIEYAKKESSKNNFFLSYWFSDNRVPDVLNTAARLIADRNESDLLKFEDNAKCLRRYESEVSSHPKYRAINGYGNNLKHPYWGTPGTPFRRYGPKNYDDGVHSIRKSVTGSELPNPRKIVQEVLLKAEKNKYNATKPNNSLTLVVLYITHDLAHQVPVEAFDNGEDIRCCSSFNKKVLEPSLSHSACLPISIGQNDPFYKPAGVGCLNMVRSELASLPSKIQYSEVMNKATAYMDHSIIYGTEDAEMRKTRTFSGGKLNLGAKNILPMDSQGKYTKSSDRLRTIPIGAIWPAVFSRHHNNLADGLKAVNPNWDDEKLYQEARRINIALFQKLIVTGKVIETAFKKKINESYNENFDASTTVEFSTAAYRFLHYFTQPDLLLIDKNNQVRSIPISDTLGRIDIVENNFDDALRGILNQPANFDQYSEEISSKFSKNKNGFGIDLLSIDIQRGRDHGLPTFLDTRRKCGIDDLKTFADLLKIFPQTYIDLLENVYDSVEDIDLYVGGALESFVNVQAVLIGETFGCIVGEQYKHTMGGDSYFFVHKTNPYPFTVAQLVTLGSFQFNQLICTTSGLDMVQKIWSYIEGPLNPKVSCSLFKPMDLSAWKDT